MHAEFTQAILDVTAEEVREAVGCYFGALARYSEATKAKRPAEERATAFQGMIYGLLEVADAWKRALLLPLPERSLRSRLGPPEMLAITLATEFREELEREGRVIITEEGEGARAEVILAD